MICNPRRDCNSRASKKQKIRANNRMLRRDRESPWTAVSSCPLLCTAIDTQVVTVKRDSIHPSPHDLKHTLCPFAKNSRSPLSYRKYPTIRKKPPRSTAKQKSQTTCLQNNKILNIFLSFPDNYPLSSEIIAY